MDGGRYFAIRGRLEAVAGGVAVVAGARGVDSSGLIPGRDRGEGPGRPLVLAVIGETNAGKSSLLNSLFGRAVCPVDALPERGPVVWYGSTGPSELPAGMTRRRLPDDERLRGFEWIDTPGANGMDRGGRELLLGCCAKADGILAVIHSANPWEPATWDLLARFGEGMLERTLVVLQQTDRIDPADLPVLRSHLRELALRKVGRELPVVAVSAARAWQAWSAAENPPGRAAWAASGFEVLEHELATRVCEAAPRIAELREWWSRAVEVLRAAEERIEEGARGVEGQGRFLAEVESELNRERDGAIEGLDEGVVGFDRAERRIRGWLSRRLGLLPSFIRCLVGDDSGPGLDRMLVSECADAAQRQAESDINGIEGQCARFWAGLEPRTRDQLAVDIGGFERVREQLDMARGRFVERCAEAVATQAAEIRPGVILADDLRGRQRLLAGLFGVLLVFFAAAGATGAMGRPEIAWWLLAAAAVVLVVTAVVGWTSKRVVLRVLDECLRDGIGELGPSVHGAWVDEVRGYFARFSRTLDPLRRRVADSRGDLQPELEQWNGLFLELQAVGQEIG